MIQSHPVFETGWILPRRKYNKDTPQDVLNKEGRYGYGIYFTGIYFGFTLSDFGIFT